VRTSETIAKALGGRKASGRWMARCPAHDDRTPSLSISDGEAGRLLFTCFAGCTFESVRAALVAQNLWPGSDVGEWRPPDPAVERARRESEARDRARRIAAALRIWNSAHPTHGTLAEAYLRARGIEIASPATLRFAPALRHPTGGIFPAMVARVDDLDGRLIGVHRTFLAGDGSRKAPLNPPKVSLGPCRGSAVRLGLAAERLVVAEGIETALAVQQACDTPTWAALGTSGLAALLLPDDVREVTICADGDDPGERAAQAAAQRWLAERRRVRIARPPRRFDFADVLVGKHTLEAAA
jgi:putative DNA primase/helicase